MKLDAQKNIKIFFSTLKNVVIKNSVVGKRIIQKKKRERTRNESLLRFAGNSNLLMVLYYYSWEI